MVTRRMVAVALLLGVEACGGLPGPEPSSPVTVEGSPADIRDLAGYWRGEFADRAQRRSGEIVFRLAGGSATAYGSVTLTSPPAPIECPVITLTRTEPAEPPPVVLRVARLAVARGSIGGWLEPYRDEERRCWVDTWFEGRMIGDRLEGYYFAHPTATDTIRVGTWWATRSR